MGQSGQHPQKYVYFIYCKHIFITDTDWCFSSVSKFCQAWQMGKDEITASKNFVDAGENV